MKYFLVSAFALLATGLCAGHSAAAPTINTNSVKNILQELETFEGKNDPKCYATASRLEDFMFGTPLNFTARNTKNNLQKQLAKEIWLAASAHAVNDGAPEVSSTHISQALIPLFSTTQSETGHWTIKFPDGGKVRINGTDKRQYSSIAYSLRALLAVQQDSLLSNSPPPLPLEPDAIVHIKDAVDLYTLAVLKVADEMARSDNRRELDSSAVSQTWQHLRPQAANFSQNEPPAKNPREQAKTKRLPPISTLELTNAVINQKVNAYAVYNQISNQLFIRNLQVYFAKKRWPETEVDAQKFRSLFTEALITLARDLYKGSQAIALSRNSATIQETDVANLLARFLPHTVNQYEDVTFFPRLPLKDQIVVESYDMDAFRDSGIHWRYLQFAIQSDGFEARLEPDPFALELITENVAHLGVLLLRITGNISTQQEQDRISPAHLTQALALLKKHIAANNLAVATPQSALTTKLASSSSTINPLAAETMFTDVTQDVGINFMHRSSDWLNRLLRSYLQKDAQTGIITIPPAFGGSGLAAGDINNDGNIDLLMLSGLGNRLYINNGTAGYVDITETAGLQWTRPDDNNPGEVRQPLIADLDNDGHQDIVITYVNDKHRVYKNNGDLTFTDVTDIANLGGSALVGGPATVFDYDNDGLLDIYISYFGDYIHGVLPTLERRNSNGLPNRLFRNTGDFVFVDVTQQSGLGNTGWGQALTHTDFDGDNLQDVIVGNDFGVNAYYKNLGDGTFKDISIQLGTSKPSYTMGIGIADLNDDLLPDFYISNIVTMNKDQKYVLPSADTTMAFNPEKLANMRVIEANDLFLSQQTKTKQSYNPSNAIERGYSSTGWSWGAAFFDSDNDGDEDLYVLNGMNEFNVYSNENPYYTDPLENIKMDVYIPVSTKESNVFFLNENGKLNNVSERSGLNLLGNSRSVVYVDYDNDGDLDIVINNYHEAARFYRNDSAPKSNHWLKVQLIGKPAEAVNRDAIGAKLIVRNKRGKRVWREIRGSSDYLATQSKQQHFGLGESETVDLDVIWPNGHLQSFTSVQANQSITIHYGSTKPTQQ